MEMVHLLDTISVDLTIFFNINSYDPYGFLTEEILIKYFKLLILKR